jgi:hypothetical protein
MKVCTKCKELKPFSMFNKLGKAKDGLQYHCVSCKLAYQRANPNRENVLDKYRNANKDLCSQRSALSQAKKRPYYTQKAIEWQEKNRERYLENRRRFYRNHSAQEIERVRRRQNKIKQGFSFMNQAEIVEVQGMYDFCQIFKGFEVDHIIPLNGKTVSGLHVLGNLQVIRRSLNRSKGRKFDADALQT